MVQGGRDEGGPPLVVGLSNVSRPGSLASDGSGSYPPAFGHSRLDGVRQHAAVPVAALLRLHGQAGIRDEQGPPGLGACTLML